MVSQRLTAFNEALTRSGESRVPTTGPERNDRGKRQGFRQGRCRLEQISPVSTNPIIQALRSRYLEAKTECADLRLRYLENHPKLEACETKMQLAKAAVQHQIQTVLGGIRSELPRGLERRAKTGKAPEQPRMTRSSLNRHRTKKLPRVEANS